MFRTREKPRADEGKLRGESKDLRVAVRHKKKISDEHSRSIVRVYLIRVTGIISFSRMNFSRKKIIVSFSPSIKSVI